ncbi:hypothetical protein [Levilactobacillus zymae]|nr:hypothetical protein [Levilactobacillus zymae]MDT6981475.1 hypothetical protein [Levilactobacillus zymae]
MGKRKRQPNKAPKTSANSKIIVLLYAAIATSIVSVVLGIYNLIFR